MDQLAPAWPDSRRLGQPGCTVNSDDVAVRERDDDKDLGSMLSRPRSDVSARSHVTLVGLVWVDGTL